MQEGKDGKDRCEVNQTARCRLKQESHQLDSCTSTDAL